MENDFHNQDGTINYILMARGTPRVSTISRWTDTSEADTKWIDKTVTTTTNYDTLTSNPIDQTQETSVYKNGALALASRRVIHNSTFDSLGNATSQQISSYTMDASVATLVNYQVLTNRLFDSSRDCTNQMVATYVDSTKAVLLSIQEIRSSGFNSSGAAGHEEIVTFSDPNRATIIGVSVIDNSGFTAQGYAGTSVVTRYSTCTIAGAGKDGAITVADLNKMDQKTITTTSFDNRGNALDQTVVTQAWTYDAATSAGSWSFAEAQRITVLASDIDIHDRVKASIVKNYSSASLTDAFMTSLQKITYSAYDSFGNVTLEYVNT